ncbi:MAG: ribosome biogenesis GTP-binding protein YihA/YsxC [Lachnospirales bacterium]
MIVNNVYLDKVGTKLEQYPTNNLMEIAFVGKSNVGKSSLINSLIGRKSLARTSKEPGKTRTINFYNVEESINFVDLPGYGYAKISKSEREKWGHVIEEYLKNRTQLKAICLLIDIRHEVQKNDLQMYEWLKYYGYNIILVCTKKDKIKLSQVQRHTAQIRKGLGMSSTDTIIPFSSTNGEGKNELWKVIDEFLSEYKIQ